MKNLLPAIRKASVALALPTLLVTALQAQNFSILYSFHYTDGAQPAGLVQANNGALYGTTAYGGTCSAAAGDGCGTIFAISPTGSFTSIYQFCTQQSCAEPNINPQAPLVQAANGEFYGTTQSGSPNCPGSSFCGTIFKVSPAGTLSTLYNFCGEEHCQDGDYSPGPLTLATNGNLYGTAIGGDRIGGTFFSITPAGTFTRLHRFCTTGGLDCTDGTSPMSGVIQATDGNFYGTTEQGGIYDGGTIFKITPSGTLTTLYSFCAQTGCPDGSQVEAGLIQARDGNFYGVTTEGGAHNAGTIFEFSETSGVGKLSTLYNFCSQPSCSDGYQPAAALIEATDGNFYGTTEYGGVLCESVDNGEGCGTIFRLSPAGEFTTLHRFCAETNCPDGIFPHAQLVQDTDGAFYGNVSEGGPNGNNGNVFRFSLGLAPFVKPIPSSGAVGTYVRILGTDLTGATAVTFNGTPAAFTVVSPSLITTRVPAGATSGAIYVSTPSGNPVSNVPFQVTP